MKNKMAKMAISGTVTMLSLYFDAMIIPLFVLIVAMIADYVSGIMAAWFMGELNSKKGKHGAIKKVCYMLLVIVAALCDWLVCCGMGTIGIEYQNEFYFGLLVTIWLILNELLSILENCTRIGLPIPGFIKPIAQRLKIMVEKSKSEEEGKK